MTIELGEKHHRTKLNLSVLNNSYITWQQIKYCLASIVLVCVQMYCTKNTRSNGGTFNHTVIRKCPVKKYLLITASIVICLSIAVFGLQYFQKKSLEDALVSAVGIKSDNLIVNLPPYPIRVPGTILSPNDSSSMIYRAGYLDHESMIIGDKFSIEAKISDISSLIGTTKNSLLYYATSSNEDLEVFLIIKDAFIAELPVAILKSLVDEQFQGAQNIQVEPLIINRAYIGTVEYIIKATSNAGVEVLSELSDKVIDIRSKRDGDFSFEDRIVSQKEVSFSIASPITFAYEALEANYVSTNLSDSGVFNLHEISARRVQRLAADNNVASPYDKKSWGAITISNAHYKNLSKLNTPQADEAASLMAEFFDGYNPTFSKSLHSSVSDPLSDSTLLDWTIDLTLELLENPVEHLFVYYTGHGLSLPNGEMILLQGNVDKDYAEKAANNKTPETSVSGDGLLLVEQLYDALAMTSVPFTMIVDACYPNDEMANALTRVDMLLGDEDGSELYYIGDNELITDELSDLGAVLRQVGNRFDYRQQANAVIFSSKPGAKSVYHPNPNNPYGILLPPMASRILKYSNYVDAENKRIPISEIIRNSIDSVNGLGEVSLDGSITWSNLKNMDKF